MTDAPTRAMPAEGSSEARLWYMSHGGRFDGDEPHYFAADDHPWARRFEEAAPMILQELRALLDDDQERLKPYFSRVMAFPPGQWKTLGFYFWKLKLHSNCKRCPRTVELLDSIPNLTAGSLSVLEPGSNINPHQGDTNAVIRAHLGLSIPSGPPDCGFQVGDEVRGWEEGKMLLFCDAHTHTAWNHTGERRLIFIVDVMRDEFADRGDQICCHVLASQALQRLYQSHAWLGRAPGRFRFFLHFVLRNLLRVFLPIQRRVPFGL